jgi:hypothetical protein
MPDNFSLENPRFDPGQSPSEGNDRHSRRVEKIPVLDEADSVTLQIVLLKENYEELLKVVADNEWEEDEGFRTVLLSGLGYLSTKAKLDEVNRLAANGDAEAAKKVDVMVKELAAYHSMYSVMKFKAFKLYKVNQVLEFNVSGLRATERMWEGWANRMRRQHAAQQAELLRLRSLMSEFKLDWDPAVSGAVTAETEVEQAQEVSGESITEAALLPSPVPKVQLSFWERLKWLLTGDYEKA